MNGRRAQVLVALSGLALLGAGAAVVPPAVAADPVTVVPALRETAPVAHAGDALDDPAVWVHPDDPARSLVIGNDKLGGLETYDMEGRLVERLSGGTTFWGNVDVRQGVEVGGAVRDVVAVYHDGLQLYDVDASTRQLRRTTEGAGVDGDGEGLCLYTSPATGETYVVLITIGGRLRQYRLDDADADGLLDGTLVRDLQVGSEAEGCVADDDTGALYVSEEERALWRYGAEPSAGASREVVDTVTDTGGHLALDIEGVTLVDRPDGSGQVIASAQHAADPGASYFVVYDRVTNDHVSSFRVGDGSAADDCDRTDGITASTADLGPAFPDGVFVCQDDHNVAPGEEGNQSFKYVPLETVVPTGSPPGPDPGTIAPVGTAADDGNARTWSVTVPGDVEPGDGLLLFLSRGTGTETLSGPGPGWTRLGSVTDGTLRTTAWQRVATAEDAGSDVAVGFPTQLVKGSLTLAAYRGTRTTGPFAGAVAAGEPARTAVHVTPLATVASPGTWRVSYWSDRSSSTTAWTPPAGEQVRSTSAGTGGGRTTTLLTDPGGPVPTGSTGGLAATADAASAKATTWTVLLAPAPAG
ncbi:phytase [Nocardioides sp. NPDC092400]|uniref:phytase n=1 Tax=Nocardioides sp. NPDC092400 TaxID=3155196 RepID=UPI0034248F94